MHIIICKWCLIPYSATLKKAREGLKKARGSENLDVVCLNFGSPCERFYKHPSFGSEAP